MKGISPLIATVLLIAFTVAVGGIMNLWINSYNKSLTTQVTSSSQDQIQCLNSVLSIKSSSFSGGWLQVTTGYDTGSLTLYNPVIDAACGSNSNTNATTWVNSTPPGGVFVVSINMTSKCGSTAPDFERIRATCIGPSTGTNYTISTECKKGQGCGL